MTSSLCERHWDLIGTLIKMPYEVLRTVMTPDQIVESGCISDDEIRGAIFGKVRVAK